MRVEKWSIDRVRPYPQNPRLNDQAVEAVARSIREFGFRQPIVVDEQGEIIVGHTRWKAAQKLGLEKVPVHVAMGLTPAQIKAYRIADNQTAALAEWEDKLMPLELADLQSLEFDLDLLGFTQDDLAKFLGTDVQDGLTDPDAVPAPPDEAVTQPGDLWLLGDHRFLCGERASRGRRPVARRGADSPREHRSALQREGGAAEQQCHRRRPQQLHEQAPSEV